MKVSIYTSVSTENQIEQKFSSCGAQEEKIKTFIRSQNNWHIFNVYSDPGYTGANTNRPAWQELFKDMKQGKINVVLKKGIGRNLLIKLSEVAPPV